MKKVYEKPEVDFNELFLFDGVAEKCWGYHEGVTIKVYKDANHNNKLDDGEEIVDTFSSSASQSCNSISEEAAAFVKSYDKGYYDFFITSTENTKGAIYDIIIPVS